MHDCNCRGHPAIFLGSTSVEVPGESGDYEALANLPSVNGVTLIGALTLAQLGITPEEMGIDEAASAYVEQAVAELDVNDEQIDEIIDA